MSARTFAAVLVVAGLSACSNTKDPGTTTLNKPDTGTTGFDLDGGGNGLGDAKFEAPAVDPDAACAASSEQATTTPVNLYVMFDKSATMGPLKTSTKWSGARNGLAKFVKDPASAGLRIALNFYPRPPDSTPACDQPAYRTPRVPFDVLPKNADPLIAAIDAENPDGFDTPTYPALGGALLSSIDEVKVRPGESGAVLMITDGEPNGPPGMCAGVDPTDPKVIAQLASVGLSKGIKTFVVLLPGVTRFDEMNSIAAAGGTTAAILATNASFVEQQFADALATVRGRALPCDFLIPTKVTKGEVNPALVNVQYTKGGTTSAATLPQDPTCAGPGWKYDDPANPTRIVLCPSTCAEVRADFKAKVDILLGCRTIVK